MSKLYQPATGIRVLELVLNKIKKSQPVKSPLTKLTKLQELRIRIKGSSKCLLFNHWIYQILSFFLGPKKEKKDDAE